VKLNVISDKFNVERMYANKSYKTVVTLSEIFAIASNNKLIESSASLSYDRLHMFPEHQLMSYVVVYEVLHRGNDCRWTYLLYFSFHCHLHSALNARTVPVRLNL
jgi:hypothetical protein